MAVALSVAALGLPSVAPAAADGNEAPDAPLAFRSISAGIGHQVCAIGEELWCWGWNNSGRLGLGDSASRGDGPGEMGDDLAAVDLGTGRSAEAVAAGSGHTCALLDDGTVKCWGANGDGQLGQGDRLARGDGPGEMGDDLLPVDLGTGRTATAITAGNGHTCAILDTGDVKCWGWNNGRLGLGDMAARGGDPGQMGDDLPVVDLGTGRTATAIAAGQDHTCAILDTGDVKCWGTNFAGQLGYGDWNDRGDGPGEMGDDLPAVDLGAGRTATAITAGAAHSCALLDNGIVKCWGWNTFGQLGYGDRNDRGDGPGEMGDALPAVDLGTGRTATAVTAENGHTCALLDDGTVKCWGWNTFGQLGYGDRNDRGDGAGEMGDDLPAIDLGAGRTASAITTGNAVTCVVVGGGVACWGHNDDGTLGIGSQEQRGDGPGEMGNALVFADLAGLIASEPSPPPTPTPTPDPTPTTAPDPDPTPTVEPAPTCMGREATIVGRPGQRRIVGTNGNDVIVTRNRAGATIVGRGGNDLICGSPGRDIIRGGPGNDRIFGLAGNDRVFGNGGRDRLVGGPGRDTCSGGPGRDRARSCESATRVR